MSLVFKFSTVDTQRTNYENWRLCQFCRQDLKIRGGKKSKRKGERGSFFTNDTTALGEITIPTVPSEKISPEADESTLNKKQSTKSMTPLQKRD